MEVKKFGKAYLPYHALMKRNLTVMMLLAAFVWAPLVDSCRQVSVLPARMLAVELADASMFTVSHDFPAQPRRVAILRRLQRERRNVPERTWTDNRAAEFAIRREIRI